MALERPEGGISVLGSGETATPATTPATAPAAPAGKQPPRIPYLTAASEAADTAASVVPGMAIPKTAMDVGLMAASALAGPAKLLPFIAKLPMPILRVILGSAGAGVGAAVEGKSPVEGAKTGALASAGGEVIGKGAQVAGKAGLKLAEKIPGVQGMIGDSAAKQVGKFAGERTPVSAGNTEELQTLAFDKGTKRKLGEYFDNRIADAEGVIGPQATLNVPALSGGTGATVQTQYGPMPASMLMGPNAGSRMTLREAAEKLADLRLQAYGGGLKNDPTARTISGSEARKMYGDALRQIEGELKSFPDGAKAAELWNDGRHAYAVGSSLVKLLQKGGVLKGDAMDLNALRNQVSRNRGWLQERMGKDDFRSLTDLVFHGGATPGAKPSLRVSLPENASHPVDLPQIMINANVQRLLNQ